MTMKKPTTMLAVLAVLSIALSAVPPTETQADSQVQTVLADAVNNFVRPGYSALHTATRRMEAAIAPMCSEPSIEALDAAHDAFSELVEAWSEIEIIRFGPVVDDNRLERLLFFPDRRGIGLKQVQSVLISKDKSATAQESLINKSVALQGLTALEYLLYGSGADALATGDTFRCAFAHAISGRLEAVSDQLENAWDAPDGITQRLVSPDAGNPDFRTYAEGMQALLGVFVNSSELIADTRLKPFIGADAESAKPKRALFWRSGLTGRAISANLRGLEKLYKTAGIERLLPMSASRFGQSALFEMENARQTIATLNQPLAQAVTNPNSHGSVNFIRIAIISIRDTFSGRIAAGLGLSAGFSSLDGD